MQPCSLTDSVAPLSTARDVAVDVAVEMQSAGEFDVAVDPRLGADQGLDFALSYSVSV